MIELTEKKCSKCENTKTVENFYKRAAKSLVHYRSPWHSICKQCIGIYNRERYKRDDIRRSISMQHKQYNSQNSEKAVERSRKFYVSMSGRAKTLLKSAQRRSGKYSEFDIDEQFILDRLNNGKCEVTNLPFDMERHYLYCKNPFSPSIDRIDCSKGYTKSNTRIVIWQYNLMKGEMTDEEVLEICQIIVNRAGIK